MTPIQRLSVLEERLDQYAKRLSKQNGELQALQAALNAIFLVVGSNPAIRDAVASQMERSIALNLAASTDQSLVDGFDSAATRVCEAMNQAESTTEPTSRQLLDDATTEYDSMWANMRP